MKERKKEERKKEAYEWRFLRLVVAINMHR
jgi:hypothetical protein